MISPLPYTFLAKSSKSLHNTTTTFCSIMKRAHLNEVTVVPSHICSAIPILIFHILSREYQNLIWNWYEFISIWQLPWYLRNRLILLQNYVICLSASRALLQILTGRLDWKSPADLGDILLHLGPSQQRHIWLGSWHCKSANCLSK